MSTWDGGDLTWRAWGRFLMWGPTIEKVCVTRTGARFAAWRRSRGSHGGSR